MKKIINVNNNPATKQDLKSLEKNLNKIIDKKFKNYPTKSDLDERFSKFANAIRNETDHKFDIMMDDFRAQMSKFTNMILTAIDPMIKYIDESREEKTIEAHQLYETRKQLDNHEKRIKKLEQS